VTPLLFISTVLAVTLAQDPAGALPDLDARVDRVVQVVDAKWVLVGSAGTDDNRIQRWRRINDTMTVQARQFDTTDDALAHIRQLVITLSVPVEETLKIGCYAARIEWGDGRSSVYMATGKTAVVISAPTAELARKLSRQVVREFAQRPVEDRARTRLP
jgi:hypothetical protein